MSSITCPRCGSPIQVRGVFAGASKPFCAQCGWNLDRAEAALAGKSTVMKFLPLGVVAIGMFAALAASQAKTPVIFLLPAVFALVALIPLWSYYSTRKAIAAAKLTVNPGLAQAQPPLDPALQMLQSLPRPRNVGFRIQGNLAVVAAVFVIAILSAFAIFALTARNLPRTPNPIGNIAIFIPLLSIPVVLVVVLVIPLARETRNRPLLRDGELAFGRVTAQQTIQQGKTSYSRIEYEFKTSTGQTIRNSARDTTKAVFEDMNIPVFYDPLDPSKNVTLCATYLRIANSFG